MPVHQIIASLSNLYRDAEAVDGGPVNIGRGLSIGKPENWPIDNERLALLEKSEREEMRDATIVLALVNEEDDEESDGQAKQQFRTRLANLALWLAHRTALSTHLMIRQDVADDGSPHLQGFSVWQRSHSRITQQK